MFHCLKCHRKLEQTPDNPEYWMCYHCIKGYTTLELVKDGQLSNDHLTDIHLYLNLLALRHRQTKSKVSNIDRVEELIELVGICIEEKEKSNNEELD